MPKPTKFIHHNDLDYCEHTRNIDQMLQIFKHQRQYIVEMLSHNPKGFVKTLWTDKSLIPKDRYCLCKMGQFLNHDLESKIINPFDEKNSNLNYHYRCSQCRNLSRLITLSPSNLNTSFKIETGKYEGEQFIIHHYFLHDLSLHSNFKYNSIISDKFTNHLLITWCLDELLSQSLKYSLNLIHIYTAFICSNSLYTLSDVSDFKDLSVLESYHEFLIPETSYLDPHIIITLLQQLYIILSVLSPYRFFYGLPISFSSLTLSFNLFNYYYNGIALNYPLLLKFTNFFNSEITLNNVKLKSKGYSTHTLFNPMAQIKTINKYYQVQAPFYQIFQSNPIYYPSFNFYILLTALMCHPIIMKSILNDHELLVFWRSLWLYDDEKIILQRINQVISEKEWKFDIELFHNLHFRYDILSVVSSFLKI